MCVTIVKHPYQRGSIALTIVFTKKLLRILLCTDFGFLTSLFKCPRSYPSRWRRLKEIKMAHYKKRKRRKGGTVGCCGMCMLDRFRCIHHRIETKQERISRLREREQRKEQNV